MNRILVVHRDRQGLDRQEKLLLNHADHQVTLVQTIENLDTGAKKTNTWKMLTPRVKKRGTLQCPGVAGRRGFLVQPTFLA